MKKIVLLVVTVMAVAALSTSCKKTCVCQTFEAMKYTEDSYGNFLRWTSYEVVNSKSEEAKNCADLNVGSEGKDEFYMKCK